MLGNTQECQEKETNWSVLVKNMVRRLTVDYYQRDLLQDTEIKTK